MSFLSVSTISRYVVLLALAALVIGGAALGSVSLATARDKPHGGGVAPADLFALKWLPARSSSLAIVDPPIGGRLPSCVA